MSATPPTPLTLDGATREALARDPRLRAAGHAATAAAAQVRAAGALPGPRLSVSPLWSDERGTDVEFQLSQPLFEPGLPAARRAARAAWAAAVLDAEELRLEVRAAVWVAYWRLAAAQRQAAARRLDVALVQQLRAAAAKAVEVGERPGVDLLRTELELSGAEQELAAAEAAMALAQPALNSVLGRDLASETLVQPERSLPAPELSAKAPDALAAARPRVRAAELRVLQRRGQLDLARAQRLPSVEAAGFREDREHGLRLTFSLPLWDTGRLGGERGAAAGEADQASAELATVRREVSLEVVQAGVAVTQAMRRRAAYLGQVVQRAQRLAELAQVGYRAGELNLLDVLDARRRLAEIRRTVIDLDLAVDEAVVAYHRAIGTAEVATVERTDALAAIGPRRTARATGAAPLGPPVPSLAALPLTLLPVGLAAKGGGR